MRDSREIADIGRDSAEICAPVRRRSDRLLVRELQRLDAADDLVHVAADAGGAAGRVVVRGWEGGFVGGGSGGWSRDWGALSLTS